MRLWILNRFSSASVIALGVLSGSTVLGGPFDVLTKIDPTNKNSDVAKATGYTFDPKVVFPKAVPPAESVIDDPQPEPVIILIDPRTGNVSEGTR